MNNQDLVSLQKLFNERVFRIPDYQRGYSWGSQQLEEFWDDLLCLLPNQDHYTGMLSYKKVAESTIYNEPNKWNDEKWLINRGYELLEIVDGQQRLTTLIILINEILNYCKKQQVDEINNTPLGEIAKKYLYEEKNGQIVKTYKFGYEEDNPSYDYFRIEILEDPNKKQLDETFYTLNLSNAKSFFRNKIEQYSNGDIGRVEDLFKKITLRLKFNQYCIEDDSNVFVAFETMNNRGKKLSYLELLKNRLIYLSTLFDNSTDEKVVVRKEINDTWKEIYEFLGKNKNHPLSDDEFLQHHWMIYFGYNTRKIQGYQTMPFYKFLLNKYFIQQRIDKGVARIEALVEDGAETDVDVDAIPQESDLEREYELSEEYEVEEIDNDPEKKQFLTLKDIQNYVRSLRELIPYWYQTYNPQSDNSAISNYIFRLNTLGYVNARPLVTVILAKYTSSDYDSIKVECLRLIERFNFMHYRLCGYVSSYSNSVFFNLARDLYRGLITIDDVIAKTSYIDYLSDDKIVENEGVINKFDKLFKYDGFYSWTSLKYLLFIYDINGTSTPAERKIKPDDYFKQDKKDQYSIEHIYPQKATDEYWTSRFNQYSESQRKRLSSSLGNMLPLSKKINSRLQNSSFDDKRETRYKTGSKSEQEVANWPGNEWTPTTILERGMNLLSFIENEFDFKFPDDTYRKKLLGLSFMENS